MQYLCRIGRCFYFRVRVPQDLKCMLKTQEIKKSLHTTSPRNAKLLVKAYTYRLERLFTLVRCGMLTDEQISKMFDDFLHEMLRQDEDYRVEFGQGLVSTHIYKRDGEEHPVEQMQQGYAWIMDEYLEDLVNNNLGRYEQDVDAMLENRGIAVEKDSVEYKKLCREYLKTMIEALKISDERASGNYHNPYDKALRRRTLQGGSTQQHRKTAPEDTAGKGVKLSEAMKQYTEEKNNGWCNKEKSHHGNVFKKVLDIIGDKDITKVTRADLVTHRNTLMILPRRASEQEQYAGKTMSEVVEMLHEHPAPKTLAAKTVNNHMLTVAALFNWAEEEAGLITHNPAKRLKIENDVSPDEQKPPYTHEELQALFSAPLFRTDMPLDRPEQFWIPLLGLFTGCRIDELCSLYIDDVIVKDGITCIDISHKRPDQHVKTPSGNRTLPIHPTLLNDIGFQRYVDSCKQRRGEGRHERLWPNLNHGVNGYAGAFGMWFNNTFSRKYIIDKKKTFHSFRHNVTTNLRDHGVSEEIRMAIDGHKSSYQAPMQLRYSGRVNKMPVKILYEQGIMKLDYGDIVKGIKWSEKKKTT